MKFNKITKGLLLGINALGFQLTAQTALSAM